jgi:8-oxo-dGTP diphosphatase
MDSDVGRFLAGIAALVWDGAAERYLLLKRSPRKDFGAGNWECVTGRVDQGESFEDALRREVWEEVGLVVQPLFMIGTTHFYQGEQRPENELVGVIYCCQLAEATAVQLSQEHSEYRWLTLEEALTLLSSTNSAEWWLGKVIERADFLRQTLPAEIIAYHRENGFELG